MTNAETISKLNNALEKLIEGYEQLQSQHESLKSEYDALNDKNTNLKEKINMLESQNRNLEDNVNTLQDSTQKDSNNINTMLDKIEGLLSNKRMHDEITSPPKKKDEKATLEKNLLNEEANEENTSNKENKIDLNRMTSLLNGLK